jgi:hypothetical protein
MEERGPFPRLAGISMTGKEHHIMKRRKKRIIVAALACFAALAFVGSAVAMPMVDTVSGGSTSSPTAVRPDDRAGVRGVVYADVSQAVGSPMRGEHAFGANQPVQLQAAWSGSGYNWGRTIGISAAALALALALVGLTIGGLRQRKPLHA